MRTLVATALLAGLCHAPAQAQISVYPNVLNVRDDGVPSTIHLRNSSDQAVPLRLYAQDFSQTPAGEHRYGDIGELPGSCGERLGFVPSDVTVPANSELAIQVAIAPGEGACWAVLWAETLPPRVTSGAAVNFRLGVKVVGSSGEAGARGEIIGVAVRDAIAATEAVRATPRSIVVRVRNTGDQIMSVRGHAEFVSVEGKGLETASIGDFTVLPGHEREAVIVIPPALQAIDHLVVPVLDFGGDFMMAARARVPAVR
jgi:hypothetical protein